ncbi:hypothetical protein DFH08DRAFT_860689 [Mycena albidolilacea]|uniref:Uncharacterized protein n=1 Tax=Mycena albidolilacea TaxID=1033008 RepID=A0AAD7EWA3_9AGAR|nr:hypothetical protein DFH08DRAFT_860689 [Mycena albidolilacea]
MKLIQIAVLFAPFMAAVLATPAVLPRSVSDLVPRCTTTIDCDSRDLTVLCRAKNWDCSTTSDAECAKHCGCVISCP